MGNVGIDVFDELVMLAAQLSGTPMAAVNVIGENRQWTVAGIGLAVGDAPRDTSLCDFAITQGEATVIQDLGEDARFADHPKTAEGLRFYAGFPLLSDEGLAVGVLCVADVQPHVLSDDQLVVLRALAHAAAAQLNARRHVAAVRAAGDQLQAVIDHAPDAFVSMDSNGLITEWNLEAQRMLGWTRAEACGHTVSELIIPPGLRAAHARGLARYLSTRESAILNKPVEVTAVTKSGQEVPVELTIAVIRDGAAVTFNSFVRDISERRAAEAARHAAEAMFRGAFEHAPIGIGLATLEGNVWFEVNPALARILGYSAQQLCDNSFRQFTHPDDINRNAEGGDRLRRGELEVYATEKRYLHRDGHVVWADLSVSLLRDPAGEPVCFISQIADITARKLAEEALHASERRLADAQHVGGVGSFEWDMRSDVVTWSDELCRIAGFAPGEHPTDLGGFMALVYEEDRHQLSETIQSTRESGFSEHDYRVRRPDGDVRWVHGRRRALTTGDGVARIIGTLQDITEQRAAEHALRDAEERFRRSFDEAPIGMALVSLEGRWMKVNGALCQITGYPEDRLVELSSQDITHPHDLPADLEHVRQLREGEAETYQTEKRYLHAEGHVVWAQLNVSLVRGESAAPMYFISQIQDITERREFEQRLQDLVRHDHLTGLLNRRGFEEELDRQLAHAERYRRGGAILMIDLDNFKAVNDTLGHKAGDELLTVIARVLVERLRKTDVLGRLGGDEFAIVLPEASRAHALQVAASLNDVLDTRAQLQVGHRVTTTASIGLAMYDGQASMDDLLAQADAHMYAVKARTRASPRP